MYKATGKILEVYLHAEGPHRLSLVTTVLVYAVVQAHTVSKACRRVEQLSLLFRSDVRGMATHTT